MDKSELLNTVTDRLSTLFSEGFVSSNNDSDMPTFIIKKEFLVEIITYLKNDKDLAFGYLTTMAGLHYPDNKGQEMGMMYQLHSLTNNFRIRIKTFFSKGDVEVPSLTPIFDGANWMERQEYDFFGFKFKGHPNLKRILNMDDMDYHPMLKQYALEDGTRTDKNDDMFGR